MIRKKYRRNSVIFIWLISYIIIFAIPLSIGTAVYINAKKGIKNEIMYSNNILLETIKKNVDSFFEEINYLHAEISFNQRLQELLKMKLPLNSHELLSVYEFRKDLRVYRISQRLVEHYYVYFYDLDLVVSASESIDSEAFSDVLIISEDNNIHEWRNSIVNHKKDACFPVKRKDSSGELIDAIAFVKPLATLVGQEQNAVTIVVVDEDKIYEDVVRFLNDSASLYVINNENIISSYGVSEIEDEFDVKLLSDEFGMLHKKIGNEHNVISYITSNMKGWKYVVAIPEGDFWKNDRAILKFAIIGMILCIGLVIVTINFFMKRNYTPIRSMMKIIGDYPKPKSSGDDELSFISKILERVINENKENITYFKQQNEILKQNFLVKLLKGKMGSRKRLNEYFQKFEINFELDYFVVMLIHIKDMSTFFKEEKSMDIQDKRYHANFIITNVMEELLSNKQYNSYFTEVEDMLACIINIDNSNTVKEQLEDVVYKAQRFIYDNFNLSFIVSTSEEHPAMAGISKAYSEAFFAMEYKLIMPNEEIIHYSNVKKNICSGSYYTLDMEQQLINNIKTADFKSAKHIIESALNNSFKEGQISIDLAKCLIFDLVSTIIKVANEIENKEKEKVIEELINITRMSLDENIYNISNKMLLIVRGICDDIEMKMKNKKSIKNRAEQYVIQNYNDVNLSVAKIADELCVHQAYLSATYKEQAGEGLLEFINKVRVENAKELLQTTDNNMPTIAGSVGYINVRTFLRVFKKYVGITPTQFKKMD